MNIQQALATVVEGEDLSREEMAAVMRQVMSGEATDAQIGGLLVALRMKGETIDEIAGAAQVMRELATPVEVAGHTWWIWWAPVAMAPTCLMCPPRPALWWRRPGPGSPSMAIARSPVPAAVPMCWSTWVCRWTWPRAGGPGDQRGGCGLYVCPGAPQRHAPCRRPAPGAGYAHPVQYSGPADQSRRGKAPGDRCVLCRSVSAHGRGTQSAGREHAMVVHSDDGLDEISIAAGTQVAELRDGSISTYHITPRSFGWSAEPGGPGGQQRRRLGRPDSRRPVRRRGRAAAKAAAMLALNAGATIYVSGVAATLADGVAMAEDVLASGQAAEKLRSLSTLPS